MREEEEEESCNLLLEDRIGIYTVLTCCTGNLSSGILGTFYVIMKSYFLGPPSSHH